MKQLTDFVQEHLGDDTSKLLLKRNKWPEIDINLAVSCIESRNKLRNKVQEWYANPELIFPIALSAEQCSSTATGIYKSRFADQIVTNGVIADLTGGLGVDTWFFSKKASKVCYHEMQEALCIAAKHNFNALQADNITIRNIMTSVETIDDIISAAKPDIVYMDPARRSESGKKVFLLEDCTPDVLKLIEPIFRHCRHILLKLSPMADITMLHTRLGKECREIHIVAYKGDCKEILIWMDREWNQECTLKAIELPSDYPAVEPEAFVFNMGEEKLAAVSYKMDKDMPGWLFEPGKAMMKAGCFNLIASRFGLIKFGLSTHYYITDDQNKAVSLKSYGKVFHIQEISSLDKRSIKAAAAAYPKSEVTARNIPMDTETFRKKLGVTSGDDAHIFGLKSDILGNLILIATRVY